MYAVIESGGKQYRVTEGDILRVERLEANPDDVVAIEKVLSIGYGKDLAIGRPYLDDKVYAKVLENDRAEKIIIYKYKAKKNYHKKKGHRQPYSLIEIVQIGGQAPKGSKSLPAEEAVEDKAAEKKETKPPVKKEKAVDKTEELEAAKSEEPEKVKVSMKMKKDELLAVAKENDVKVTTKMTKQEIIDAIEEDLK